MPINNITQTVSELPAPPHRGVDVQSIFVTKQEDFQDHLQGITVVELNALVTQQNTMVGAMNSTATQVDTNANTATTKAGEANTSASSASTSASQALTSRNQAETFAQQASASALSVDASNIVHRTGNETIAGVKTFSSSPIVPTPTTDTQATNKQYVDGKYSGFKNYIINGNFDIWQRGGGPFTGYNYGPDRWVCGNGTHSSSATAGNVGKRIIHISNIVADSTILLQAIELNLTGYNAPFNVGKTFTISIRYSSSTRIKPMVQFTTGASGNSPVDIFSTAEYKGGSGIDEVVSWTFTVPNNCGATNNCALLAIIAKSDVADCYMYSVQLEEGSVATPFEHRPYGLELSLCHRYYQIIRYFTTMSVETGRCHVMVASDFRVLPSISWTDNVGNVGKFSVNGVNNITVNAGGFGGQGTSVSLDSVFAQVGAYISVNNLTMSAEL